MCQTKILSLTNVWKVLTDSKNTQKFLQDETLLFKKPSSVCYFQPKHRKDITNSLLRTQINRLTSMLLPNKDPLTIRRTL